jgi:hypothetical protein
MRLESPFGGHFRKVRLSLSLSLSLAFDSDIFTGISFFPPHSFFGGGVEWRGGRGPKLGRCSLRYHRLSIRLFACTPPPPFLFFGSSPQVVKKGGVTLHGVHMKEGSRVQVTDFCFHVSSCICLECIFLDVVFHGEFAALNVRPIVPHAFPLLDDTK